MKNKIVLTNHLYFVTSSLAIKEKLFKNKYYRNIIVESLRFLIKNKNLSLYAFCIMPDHLHLLIETNNNSLNKITARFSSFTSHEIIKKAKDLDDKDIIKSFKTAANKDSDRSNRVWEDVLTRHVTDIKTLHNFLEYIHSNPTNKGWHLVQNRADYKYSSACFYDKGEEPIIKIKDVRDLMV